MSTQCRFCGEAVRPDTMFCTSCGQLIGMPGGAVPPFPGGPRPAAADAPKPPAAKTRIDPVPLPAPVPSAGSKPASPEPVQPVAPAHPTAIVLPDGTSVPIDRPLVLGRAPEKGADQYAGTPLRLDDPERAMSRVHLIVAPLEGGAAATDPGSANGTFLDRDGVRFALVSGQPAALVVGDRLVLGDAVIAVA